MEGPPRHNRNSLWRLLLRPWLDLAVPTLQIVLPRIVRRYRLLLVGHRNQFSLREPRAELRVSALEALLS
jgi:hypothetical protein